MVSRLRRLLVIRRTARPATRLLRRPRLTPHHIQRLREIRLDAPISEIRARLLNALDLPLHAPALALLSEPSAHYIHHRLIQAAVEAAALGQVVLVPVLQPAVRVQVPAELEQEVEGVARPAREGGEAADVGEEFEHAGGEGGGGEGVVEVVLQAVKVEVYDGDFAVELCIEGLCRVGG